MFVWRVEDALFVGFWGIFFGLMGLVYTVEMLGRVKSATKRWWIGKWSKYAKTNR